MKNKSTVLTFYIILILMAACRQGPATPEQKPPRQTPKGGLALSKESFSTNKMSLSAPEERTFPEVVRVNGMLDVPPENRIVISAIYGGFIKNTYLLVGDKVRKGQLLVRLENPEFIKLQQQYLELIAQLPYLKSEFKRQQTLFEEKISSEKLFLKAQSDYRTAESQKSSLEAQLRLLGVKPDTLLSGGLQSTLPIYAPIDGKVTRINIRKGAYVSPATEVLEIVNQEHLHLELTVFEKDVKHLSKGQEIRFTLPEVSNETYTGKIYLIGSTIDENRTVKVHGHLDEESDNPFLVGMYVQADILLERDGTGAEATHTLPALPEASLRREGEASFCWVLDSEDADTLYFRKVVVQPGISYQGFRSLQGAIPISAQEKVLVGSRDFPIPSQ